MTDEQIKMLELAAKAAGHTLSWSTNKDMCWLNEVWEGCMNADDSWNPLVNRHDAFCLMTKLKLSVVYDHIDEYVNVQYVNWKIIENKSKLNN